MFMILQKNPRTVKTNYFERRIKQEDLHTFQFQNLLQSSGNQYTVALAPDRNKDQWKKLVSLKWTLHSWLTDTQQKQRQDYSVRKADFSTNGTQKLHNHMQKMKVNPYLTAFIKINSQWIKDMNVRA